MCYQRSSARSQHIVRSFEIGLGLGLAVLLAFTACSCNLSDQPVFLKYRRPANVLSDATLVDQPKGGLWQRCIFDPGTDTDRCQIYNWGGALLYDEEFLAYDGNGAVVEGDLKIPGYAPLSGPDRVCLANGRILIPKSRYEEVRRHLDRVTGKRTRP
jgi:hypothetical protein